MTHEMKAAILYISERDLTTILHNLPLEEDRLCGYLQRAGKNIFQWTDDKP